MFVMFHHPLDSAIRHKTKESYSRSVISDHNVENWVLNFILSFEPEYKNIFFSHPYCPAYRGSACLTQSMCVILRKDDAERAESACALYHSSSYRRLHAC